MHILGTEFSLRHRALELYVAGCKGPHCVGCHNPESHDFGQGKPLREALFDIQRKLQMPIVHRVWVLGGEPLDQPMKDLIWLLQWLKTYEKEVWLFTRRKWGDVPTAVKLQCDYMKTGRYDATRPAYVSTVGPIPVTLASDNQRLHRVSWPTSRS